MADYLDSNILAQSYVHVEPEWLANTPLQERNLKIAVLSSKIVSYANERMPFFLYQDVHVKVEFLEGSIISKATAYGSIALLLSNASIVVKDYPTYRQGVKAIVADVVRVTDSINTEILFYTNSKARKEIKAIEARRGIFGKLDRINNKIGELVSLLSKKESSPVDLYPKMLDLHRMLIECLSEIRDVEDIGIIKKSILEGTYQLNFTNSNLKIKDESDRVFLEYLKQEKKKITESLLERDGP